jgi:hypothetical protein
VSLRWRRTFSPRGKRIMSFLYRSAVAVTRKQPYLDWANSLDDGGPALTAELSRDRRTIYLVHELDAPANVDELIDEYWEEIFEQELAAWVTSDDQWPAARTRDMFIAWFDVEVTDAVYDLLSDEPLTQSDVDTADLQYALSHCSWCDVEVEEGAGRFAGFPLPERERLDVFEGRAFALPIDDETSVCLIMTFADSDPARAGEDLLVRVCSSRCEKRVRKVVPKALRRFLSHASLDPSDVS